MRAPFVLCLVLTLSGCGGPLGPIAGGRLRGVVATEPVADWAFVRQQKRIQVETRPERPHSVTTEYLLVDGRLYVASPDPDKKRWPRLALDDPEVRLRVDGVIYEARARRVANERERETLLQAIAYERGPHDPALDLDRNVWFFRIEPR
jgi:hypothetical protein